MRTPPGGQPATSPLDGPSAGWSGDALGPAGRREPVAPPSEAGRPNGNGRSHRNGVLPAGGPVRENGRAHGALRDVAGPADGRQANGTTAPRRPGPPANGAPRADGVPPARRPSRYGAVPPPVRGARPSAPVRPDPADDEPTEVHDDLSASLAPAATPSPEPASDTESPAEAPPAPAATVSPGRHRRRAGVSATSRPASEYQAQAAAARGGKKVRPGRRRRENFWRELPLLIVVALVLTFLIQTFMAKVYVIPSGSMETTLHGCTGCNNDRVLVDKVTYRFSDPAPGDVVVFRGPDGWINDEFSVPPSDNALLNGLQQFGSLIGLAPPDEKDFVKRVIAVGGQTVQCCDSRDRLLVDGDPLDEPYVYYLPEAGPAREQRFDAVTVPEGHLWMMGDSRNNSSDSRAAGHGAVPVENVIGQARLIVLPFGRFGWIESIDPQTTTAVGMGGSDGAGAPLAMGLLGTLPLAVWRRRRAERGDPFLP
ncbi:signal peptidase I [Pseudonocardia hydrocarbonoxydans]|uniref:signal peptidase I n=1 Tax=Pseudonocardia hydrocarbonoxydans TaxID=76726 RepID=UPI00351A0DF8